MWECVKFEKHCDHHAKAVTGVYIFIIEGCLVNVRYK